MNYLKLRGKIKEKGLTEAEFAKKLSLSNASLSFKFNGKSEWKTSEIIKAIDILEISPEEIVEYFFSTKS